MVGKLPAETTFELRPESEERFIDPDDGQTVRFVPTDDRVRGVVTSGIRATKID